MDAHTLKSVLISAGVITEDQEVVPLSEAGHLLPTAEELVGEGRGEITVKEAARVLGTPIEDVESAIERGALQVRKVGKVCLVDAASVRDFRA